MHPELESAIMTKPNALFIRERIKEDTMELKMRMDLLAVIMSFGFVAAIVLGMI